MRINVPDGFSIDSFFEGIYTFQRWEIFPGYKTRGPKDVLHHMEVLGVPARLDGLRVLDIAPWNGFFGFECIRRGAKEVISLGPDDPDATGYNKVRELLEIKNCQYIRASVYDLSPEVHGTFDVVLFLGLIYHLRHPLLALDRIFDIASDRLFSDTPTIDRTVFDKTVSPALKEELLNASLAYNQLPMAYFTKGEETGDPYNWFMPNILCFKAFVESSGFTIDKEHDDGGGWFSVGATKARREFSVGIEGWNPYAAAVPNDVEPVPEQPVAPPVPVAVVPESPPASSLGKLWSRLSGKGSA